LFLRPCHIPTGNASFCVPFDRCPMLQVLIDNLQKPLPGDVSLIIADSFFCPDDDGLSGNSGGEVQVCCPLQGIQNPTPTRKPTIRNRESCSVQSGDSSSCVKWSRCAPLLQLLTNLRRPFPPELPQIMQAGFLCGFDDLGGFFVPKVCCPNEAVTEEEGTVSSTTTTTTQPDFDLTDFERFARHPSREALAPIDDCGTVEVQGRIVNGEDALLGAYPWLANLGYQHGVRGGEVQWKCGGSLIGTRYVVTAAHCVTNLPGSFKLTKIRLGEHRFSTDLDCTGDENQDERFRICADPVQDFDVDQIIFHPSYNKPNVFQNDIAVVRLSRNAILNDYVRPICLPYRDDADESYISLEDPTDHVAGWGATEERGRNPADVLQFLNISVFNGDNCRDVYNDRGGVIDLSSQMCAGGEAGRDSCVGDSGSALMREVSKPEVGNPKAVVPVAGEDQAIFKSFWKLIGVVSFGPRICGTEGVPGVYTKVRHYLDWILENIQP